jgi:hypothetical protein
MRMLNVYACGGCGMNIVAKSMHRIEGKGKPGFASLNEYFLDTSRSNVDPSVMLEDTNLYILDGKDGAGKDRSAVAAPIAERVPDMLFRFRPGDVNVVVHSAAGGSGSVIGPVLVGELLARKIPTLVLVVGSLDTPVEIQNTINTLMGYENAARTKGAPVVAGYFENSKDTPRKVVDDKILSVLAALCIFFSGENRELDSADLNNLINYPNHPMIAKRYEPGLAHFGIYSVTVPVERDQIVISAASIIADGIHHDPGVKVDYQAYGYLNPETARALDVTEQNVVERLPLHLAVKLGYYPGVIKRLQAALSEHDEGRRAVKIQTVEVDTNLVSAHGLVL